MNSQTHRVLIADDNAEAAECIAVLLQMDGHQTLVVPDGIEALEALEAFRPDVAIVDINMPRLNGLALAVEARKRSAKEELLLVALSGYGQAGDKSRSADAGFDVHLVKPVDFDKLEATLAGFRPRGR